jgi:hypothetical protein
MIDGLSGREAAKRFGEAPILNVLEEIPEFAQGETADIATA